jgi:hypothetical protein
LEKENVKCHGVSVTVKENSSEWALFHMIEVIMLSIL